MKGNYPGDNDKPLQTVLEAWKVTSPLPLDFQAQVWRRIQHAERQTNATDSLTVVISNWIATVLPRPALAACYVAALLAVGATFGWAQSQQRTARVSNDLSLRYVRSIDPYQTHR